jgi:hypothetical protein
MDWCEVNSDDSHRPRSSNRRPRTGFRGEEGGGELEVESYVGKLHPYAQMHILSAVGHLMITISAGVIELVDEVGNDIAFGLKNFHLLQRLGGLLVTCLANSRVWLPASHSSKAARRHM